MSSIDFRQCLYGLSDVVMYRPKPLRIFDQIHMKLPDMLLQAELISRWFSGLHVAFIGDGDAIGMSLVHLASQNLLSGLPAHICILDFDERVVNSVNRFANHHGYQEHLHAELYNVADAMPAGHWEKHDAFYTNPPWGASNDGESVLAFIERGIEAVKGTALGCIVIGDHQGFPWTHEVQLRTQKLMIDSGFRVSEMIPEFHRYHLDDSPELTSCSLVMARSNWDVREYSSKSLSSKRLENFYGRHEPLKVHYIRDLLDGDKYPTKDVKLETYEGVK